MSDQTQTQQAPEQRDYTLAELDSAVAAGSITQQQRDTLWTNQVQRNSIAASREEARQVVTQELRAEQVDGRLKEYASLVPDIVKENSPTRQRIAAEFDDLVANGADPKSLATELAAVKAVMGPIDRIRAHKAGRKVDPSPFGDTTGGRSASPQQRREDEAWGQLTERQRTHYEDLIRKNIYPDRAAAIRELNRSAMRRQGIDPDKQQRRTA